LAGMIQRFAAEMFGTGATSHVETVRRVTVFESSLGEAAGIAGVAGSFQSMHQNDLGQGFAGWALRVHQHLHARFSLVKSRGDWETLLVEFAAPVIAGDGGEVRIPEEGDEGAQATILVQCGHKSRGHDSAR